MKVMDKRKLLLQRALTSYTTHGKKRKKDPLSLNHWLEAQEAKRGEGTIAVRYREMLHRS